ncbi:hypothetical protein RAS1_06550 [Phycisphaerae bacterium RAS1]|nr:hypothetical protein RAS1_06550 [Phycisphaerae bacterium RAS1]
MTRVLVSLSAVGLALAACTLLIQRDAAPAVAAAPLGAAARPAAAASGDGQPAAATGAYRGLAIQLRTGFGPVERYGPLLREIADLGADTVMLCPCGFMEHARSQGIFVDVRKTPSPPDLVALTKEARRLGLRPIIMPMLLLTNPRGSEWRGVIEPPEWNDWWRQYREFIIHFADIARDGGAEALMVGSELVTTEKYTAEWIRVIEAAREHYPGGKLGYSANWDHYKPVQFWDKLDLIGMTSYHTLADKKNPSVDEIAAKWKPICDEVAAWQKKIGRPILMTEVGWCSQEGAAMAPWNYYANQVATPAGHEEQRRLYEAFIRAWNGSGALGGVIWWEWQETGGEKDYGYTPKGKPAETVLRRWFSESRTSPADAATNGGR